MSLAGDIALVIVLCVLLQNILLFIAALLRSRDADKLPPETLPKIAVLIACRNEEHTISRCLETLLSLNYPEDKLTIWVGNDESEDNTSLILRKYAQKHPRIRVVDVNEQMGHARGKANVLAHLCRRTSAEFLFFTDADTVVPQAWVMTILPHFNKGVGMVVGSTLVSADNLWGKVQRNDWALAQAMLKTVSDYFRPVTGMGNNMAISREAYLATGGYEALPPTIVEDFELFRAIKKASFSVRHLVSKPLTALTLPVDNLSRLLHQRKRWMQGALQIHWLLRGFLMLQALYYPSIILLFIFTWPLSLSLALVKSAIQIMIIAKFVNRAGRKSDIISLLIFELYSATLSLTLLFFYFLPVKIRWKNREY
ncbi:MAG: glycosyltransferase [Cyclobacteriaceae bacterium]